MKKSQSRALVLHKDNEKLSRLKIIRMLNDDFRASVVLSKIFLTPGILEFDIIDQCSILECVRLYQCFDEEDDLVHDRGQFKYAEKTISWEIHYFTPDLQGNSSDPSDTKCTVRHLSVALDDEL